MAQLIVSEHLYEKSLWNDVLSVWKSGQVGLPQVIRWSKYYRNGQTEKVRRQDSLQHSYSITILGKIVCHKLRPYVFLDEVLLQNALLIHDHGEGEILHDTLYIDKSESGDLKEYEAFVKRYSILQEDLFQEFHRAFLLQFALKDPLSFPTDARFIMAQLYTIRRSECLAFDAIEKWDYVLYALEQFIEQGNVKILVQTMRHQMQNLDWLAKELPGFDKQIWTDSIRSSFVDLLAHYDGFWIEQKGEK